MREQARPGRAAILSLMVALQPVSFTLEVISADKIAFFTGLNMAATY
ncbi:hypothetical protein G3N59_26360 [Paraburkholderia sp. Ac-20340]|nr:hypothetical protein [Paraburkholderia sp. Ac-20340]MBN3856909.1 hypothetical protein [Paraburkholderia sp. Ac-20340]